MDGPRKLPGIDERPTLDEVRDQAAAGGLRAAQNHGDFNEPTNKAIRKDTDETRSSGYDHDRASKIGGLSAVQQELDAARPKPPDLPQRVGPQGIAVGGVRRLQAEWAGSIKEPTREVTEDDTPSEELEKQETAAEQAEFINNRHEQDAQEDATQDKGSDNYHAGLNL